ncbi:MAG TPA: class I SAM-dependent methyltransferase [Pyrinomonadaceae bacterium]|nr:class I SAM-dependent methyltransferase [Pyrinomonadaceae bacterium]
MLSVVEKGYRTLVPQGVRATLWRWRRRLRNLPVDQNGFPDTRRRFKGQCNVCHSQRVVRYSNSVVASLPFSFYSCQDCGFIFVFPLPLMPSSVYYEALTMPDFGEGEELWINHYFDAVTKHSTGKGKLLEIGFGNASFIQLAHEKGWEIYGAELSVPLADRARDVLKLPNIRLGTIDDLEYPENFFDVIAGFNFLEHVPDPRKTLEHIQRLLRPSGLAVVMCPNISGIFHSLMPDILAGNDPLKISWCPPDHISYFNKTNLRMLLEDVGFTVVGDESHLMNSLWRQFEVSIGPKATDKKLEALAAKIRSSALDLGDARVRHFEDEIKALVVERMTWTMISDLMKLEPLLGAEPGILMIGKKA